LREPYQYQDVGAAWPSRLAPNLPDGLLLLSELETLSYFTGSISPNSADGEHEKILETEGGPIKKSRN
jgi:hypothetical protein